MFPPKLVAGIARRREGGKRIREEKKWKKFSSASIV